MPPRSQAVLIVAALVVGAGIGLVIGRSKAPVATGTNNQVVVGPTCPDLSPSWPVCLSKSAGDTVTWSPADLNNKVIIEFPAAQPFYGMLYDAKTGRYVVSCPTTVCTSGNISANAGYGDYKYWQSLVASNGSTICTADGHIIINK